VAVKELVALKPDFADVVREDYETWLGPSELVDHIIEGCRKARLDVKEPT
jgi:hypothetical protein